MRILTLFSCLAALALFGADEPVKGKKRSPAQTVAAAFPEFDAAMNVVFKQIGEQSGLAE